MDLTFSPAEVAFRDGKSNIIEKVSFSEVYAKIADVNHEQILKKIKKSRYILPRIGRISTNYFKQ